MIILRYYVLDGIRTTPRLSELRVDGSISPSTSIKIIFAMPLMCA